MTEWDGRLRLMVLKALDAAGLSATPSSITAMSAALEAVLPDGVSAGETRVEWGLRRNYGDVGTVLGGYPNRWSAEAACRLPGWQVVPPTLACRTIHVGPWREAPGEDDCRPGDPDPTAHNIDDMCTSTHVSADGAYGCTRRPHATGRHVAGDCGEVLAVWDHDNART